MKMNRHLQRVVGLGGLFLLAVSASAIERPQGDASTKQPAPSLPAEPQGGILKAEQKPDQPDPQTALQKQAELPKVAFLGVGGEEASKALKYQLEIENGLLLSQIAPDSPAALAGLAEFDIVLSIDETALSDQDSLRKALEGYQPGDEVELSLVRRAQKIVQKIVLGEKESRPQVQALIPEPARNLNRLLNKQFDFGQQLGGLGDDQLRKQLLEQVERAFGPQGADGIMELKLDLNGMDFFQGGNQKNGFRGFGTMRLQDNEGSIEMKRTDGQQELTIRDNEGKVLFSGPYDTEIDQEAVPEEYRDRVERLLGNGGGFQLKLGGDLRPQEKAE